MILRSLCFAALLFSAPAAMAGSNGVVATVNGNPILKSDVEDRTKALTGQLQRDFVGAELKKKLDEVYQDALDTLIRQELVLKEYEPFAASNEARINNATDEHINDRYVREMFKGDRTRLLAELKLSGKTWEKFREEQKKGLIMQMMMSQYARDDQPITNEDKEAYLRAHSDEFRDNDSIKLWTLSIPMQGELGTTPESQALLAKEVRTRLVKGADFAEMAKTHSADSKSSNGGDWGWVTKKDIARALGDLVFKLPAKEISEVMPLGDHFYIFWIEAKKPGQLKPREQIDPELEARVRAERRKKAQDEYIEKLKKKAVIKINKR